MNRPSGEYTGLPSKPGLLVIRFASPPATGTRNKSPFVLMASTLSVAAVKQISLESGEKLMSSGPPRWSGGTSYLAPAFKSRASPLPSAGSTNKWLRFPSNQWSQWRYKSSSYTRTFTLFFSFSSSRFLSHGSSLQSGYTDDVKAIVFPSGAHLTISAPVERCVTACASPPSIDSTYTCEFPSRDDKNASVFPSGDHAGEESCPLCVSCTASPPPVETIQMLLALRFALMSGVATANAAHLPSGEILGSPTRCIRIMSSNEIACFAASCAKLFIAQHKKSPAAARPLRKTLRIMIFSFAFAGKSPSSPLGRGYCHDSAPFPRPSGTLRKPIRRRLRRAKGSCSRRCCGGPLPHTTRWLGLHRHLCAGRSEISWFDQGG